MGFDTIDINNEDQKECLLELFSDQEVRTYLPQFDVHENFSDFLRFTNMKEIRDRQCLVRYKDTYVGWMSAVYLSNENESMIELFYAVRNSKRGNGLGKMMIEYFMEQISDEVKIKMEADISNIHSQNIIESLGFEKYEEEIEANMYRYSSSSKRRNHNS